MAIEITIDEERVRKLSVEAQNTLKTQVDHYVNDVIREAGLIEEALRENGANQEITSTHIVQAVRRGKRDFSKREPKYLTWCRIISPISMMIAGFLFNEKGLADNSMRLILFAIVIIIATGTTIVQFTKGRE